MKNMMISTHVSPFSSLGCTDHSTVINAISNRCRQELSDLVTALRGESVQEVHLFKDDPSVALPQKRMEQTRRDANRCSTNIRSTGDDDTGGRVTGTIRSKQGLIVNLKGPCDFSWKNIVLGNRTEKDIMSSVYVFAAAKEAVTLRPNVKVFIHSCSAVVSDEAVGACLQSLTFQRHRTGTFIVNVTDGAEIVVGVEDPESPTWIGGTSTSPRNVLDYPRRRASSDIPMATATISKLKLRLLTS